MGSCGTGGYDHDSYSVVRGGDCIIPVDIYFQAARHPEALLYGILRYRRRFDAPQRSNGSARETDDGKEPEGEDDRQAEPEDIAQVLTRPPCLAFSASSSM